MIRQQMSLNLLECYKKRKKTNNNKLLLFKIKARAVEHNLKYVNFFFFFKHKVPHLQLFSYQPSKISENLLHR